MYRNSDTDALDVKEKVAFFPDGYIKPKDVGKKPQSERANKHILELTNIKENSNNRTIMFYVIQLTRAGKNNLHSFSRSLQIVCVQI